MSIESLPRKSPRFLTPERKRGISEIPDAPRKPLKNPRFTTPERKKEIVNIPDAPRKSRTIEPTFDEIDQMETYKKLGQQMLSISEATIPISMKEIAEVFIFFNNNVEKLKKLTTTYHLIKFHKIPYTYSWLIHHMYMFAENVMMQLESYTEDIDRINLITAINVTREYYTVYWAPHEMNRSIILSKLGFGDEVGRDF